MRDNPGSLHLVAVPEAARVGAVVADAEPDRRTGLRRLYVVLTRAVTSLPVVHHRPIPSPLGPSDTP